MDFHSGCDELVISPPEAGIGLRSAGGDGQCLQLMPNHEDGQMHPLFDGRTGLTSGLNQKNWMQQIASINDRKTKPYQFE